MTDDRRLPLEAFTQTLPIAIGQTCSNAQISAASVAQRDLASLPANSEAAISKRHRDGENLQTMLEALPAINATPCSCAFCGTEIPDEQPESIRGWCNDACKQADERGDTGSFADTDDESEIDEEVLEGLLAGLISESEDLGAESGHSVRTFEEAAVLTHNRGLVLRTPDGREYQINILRSR